MFLHNCVHAASIFAKERRKPQPRKELATKKLNLNPQSHAFEEYYDEVQEHLKVLSGMDELMAGLHE